MVAACAGCAVSPGVDLYDTAGVPLVDKVAKSTEIYCFAAFSGNPGIQISMFKNLMGVKQSFNDRSLAGGVGAEEEGDGGELDADPLAYAFEVLDLDGGDHARASSDIRF